MKKYILFFLLLLIVPISYKLYRIYQHQNDLKEAKELSIGKSVPNIELVTNSGKKILLRNQKGKIIVVEFWASWCKYCLAEIPQINSFYKGIKDNPDIEFISIAIDEDIKDAQKIIESKGIKYPVAYDKKLSNGSWKYMDKFRVVGVPSIWVIDKRGKIVALNLQTIKEAKRVISSLDSKGGSN
jgi:peroxiredoxin